MIEKIVRLIASIWTLGLVLTRLNIENSTEMFDRDEIQMRPVTNSNVYPYCSIASIKYYSSEQPKPFGN